MKTLRIRGREVPALGLGTWRLEGDHCRQIVQRALELGYRHLDTAQGYGNEAEIGAAIRHSGVPRDALFLTTKAWPDDLVKDPQRVKGSLDRLGVAQVDLFLMHWPSPTLPLGTTLDALWRIKESGQAREVGVSNFPPGMLAQALRQVPGLFCNQVEYHPFLAQGPLLHLAREHDLLLTAYSPLARGEVLHPIALQEIAARHGKTPAQVALRWLLQQDQVAAIPKAGSEAHLRSNLALFDFTLDDAEMRRIHALACGKRLVHPDHAPDWNA